MLSHSVLENAAEFQRFSLTAQHLNTSQNYDMKGGLGGEGVTKRYLA